MDQLEDDPILIIPQIQDLCQKMDSNRGMCIFLATDYATGRFTESGTHDGLEFLLKNSDITDRFQEFCRLLIGNPNSDCFDMLEKDDMSIQNDPYEQTEASSYSLDQDSMIDVSPLSDTGIQSDPEASKDTEKGDNTQGVDFDILPSGSQQLLLLDKSLGRSGMMYSSVIQSERTTPGDANLSRKLDNVGSSDGPVSIDSEKTLQSKSDSSVGLVLSSSKRSDLIEREVHETSHKRQFVCLICQMVFTDSTKYYQHSKVHGEEKQKSFTCKCCKMNFINRKEYIYHSCVKQEVLQLGFVTEQPGADNQDNAAKGPVQLAENSRQKAGVNESVNDVIVKDTTLSRDECTDVEVSKELRAVPSKALDKRELQSRYAGMYSNGKVGKSFECKFCKRTFRQEIAVLRHIQVHESTNFQEKFTCKICGRECKTDETYKYHMKTHVPKEHQEFQCEICEKGFSIRSKLHKHIEIVHRNSKNFVCEICGKKFKQNKQLRVHIRIHTGDRPFKCSHCPETFRSNEHLQAHVRQWHEKTQVVCDICGLVFSSKERLRNHRWRHNMKSQPCNVCGKVLKGRTSFLSHYTTHHLSEDSLKDFPHKVLRCPHCRKLFTNSHAYKAHLRGHTGEKPFACDTCGKSFAERGNLRAHKKIHTDEKSFQCSQCGKRFTKQWNVKNHERSHCKKTKKDKTVQSKDVHGSVC